MAWHPHPGGPADTNRLRAIEPFKARPGKDADFVTACERYSEIERIDDLFAQVTDVIDLAHVALGEFERVV